MQQHVPNQFIAVNAQNRQTSQPSQKERIIRGSRFAYAPQVADSGKSLYAKVWDWVVDLIFEEAEPERPIGITQLSRQTFQATPVMQPAGVPVYQGVFFQHERRSPDYRFTNLVRSR